MRELRPERHVYRASSLSAGGVFFPDAPPRPVGTRLLLEIDLLDGFGPVLVAATVVHSGKKSGIGIEFAVPQPVIGQYVTRLSRW